MSIFDIDNSKVDKTIGIVNFYEDRRNLIQHTRESSVWRDYHAINGDSSTIAVNIHLTDLVGIECVAFGSDFKFTTRVLNGIYQGFDIFPNKDLFEGRHHTLYLVCDPSITEQWMFRVYVRDYSTIVFIMPRNNKPCQFSYYHIKNDKPIRLIDAFFESTFLFNSEERTTREEVLLATGLQKLESYK